ncbi:7-carboxy-7-deazaguanine synthase QueE [Basilea psittacipulmonis]|uniref:7-carboxy-7-deazaguanine synthase n=1 Tax=Basilea psittacipulmonis DSM 24701 TaxID=1072685 RepID=A0A077DJQ1_9BURK|nr:7-carboxy-7-deazaguanine synthase QueE [Basilea psittacipulmonis]AIL33308.1 7-carboxy-7-deazaguanine synthase [Basilea psittacipulmonis DSM 24701]
MVINVHAESAVSHQYRIVEIFESLQGEGYFTGTSCIFLRFGKCNLRCSWCDTNYEAFQIYCTEDILQRISIYQSRTIIITGGEPTIQPYISDLLQILKARGYRLHIETNGLKPVPKEIDYIAVSPKALYAKRYQKSCITQADEVRIVVDQVDILPFCKWVEHRIKAEHYYLSPCEVNGQMNIYETIRQIGLLNARGSDYPHWQLSIQTHKLAGIE